MKNINCYTSTSTIFFKASATTSLREGTEWFLSAQVAMCPVMSLATGPRQARLSVSPGNSKEAFILLLAQ